MRVQSVGSFLRESMRSYSQGPMLNVSVLHLDSVILQRKNASVRQAILASSASIQIPSMIC